MVQKQFKGIERMKRMDVSSIFWYVGQKKYNGE